MSVMTEGAGTWSVQNTGTVCEYQYQNPEILFYKMKEASNMKLEKASLHQSVQSVVEDHNNAFQSDTT